MTWQPIVLLGFAGFLIGGVAAAWKNSARIVAAVLAVLALGLAVGGVLWLM